MSVLVLLVGALGVLLLFQGLTGPPARRRHSAKLEVFLAEAGWRMSPATFIGGSVLCALLGLFGGAAAGPPALALVAGMTTASLPAASLARARARRRTILRTAWPEALTTLIAYVRSGSSLPEACVKLADRGPEALKPAFETFAASYRVRGRFGDSLQDLKATVSDPVGDRVVLALSFAHDVGGSDVVSVLRAAADMVRSDALVRREIEARWSWTVTAARVAAAAPWVVLALMLSRPEGAAAFGRPGGGWVIAIGALATFAGYRVMLRIARLPEEERLR